MKYFTLLCCLVIASLYSSNGFTTLAPATMTPNGAASTPIFRNLIDSTRAPSSTALGVWFFGGSPSEQTTTDDESCELVAVRIERPSSNSRKIFGEITVPASLEDVWAILTDYDRLSVHVPNLVESKIVQRPPTGEQGDGSYRCRLFQRGAQKIVGFEFGASVTMDMKETASDSPFVLPEVNGDISGPNGGRNRQRAIEFKCAESFFFKEFDGEWKAVERIAEDGTTEVMLSYVVDVRPNGPVPVAALEWRIREDVPTNLRAVKKAAMEVGLEGVLASRVPKRLAPVSSAPSMAVSSAASSTRQRPLNGKATVRNGATRSRVAAPANGRRQSATSPLDTTRANKLNGTKRNGATAAPPKRKMSRVMVQWETWEESETMAAYLDKNNQ